MMEKPQTAVLPLPFDLGAHQCGILTVHYQLNFTLYAYRNLYMAPFPTHAAIAAHLPILAGKH